MQICFSDIFPSWVKSLSNLTTYKKRSHKKSHDNQTKKNLVPCERLTKIWQLLAIQYFPNCTELNTYVIGWSTRKQKRTLASCSIEKRMVRVARELNYPELHIWLEPLVYHEMCHAVLGKDIPIRHRKRCWHGAEFKNLESQHPQILLLDQWIKNGGWSQTVRSDRAKRARKTFKAHISQGAVQSQLK